MKFNEARQHIGMKKEEFLQLQTESDFHELKTIDVIIQKQLPCGCIIEYSAAKPGSERRFSCPNPHPPNRDYKVRFLKEYEMIPGHQPRVINKLHVVNFTGNQSFIRKHFKRRNFSKFKPALLEAAAGFLDPTEVIEDIEGGGFDE